MQLITLGPAQTFSHRASLKFIESSYEDVEISYEKTILSIFDNVEKSDKAFGVVPIENLSEGFVQQTLDGLLSHKVNIIGELILDVQFAFAANCTSLSNIKKVFVQPVAYGQCQEFIAGLSSPQIIYTNSNMESLEYLLSNERSACGAIIPAHIDTAPDLPLRIANVSDYAFNKTRFILFKKGDVPSNRLDLPKISLLIRDDRDHSGILSAISGAFGSRKINMTSIISRPTKEAMGRYHFFIDLINDNKETLSEALNEIGKQFPMRIIGAYNSY